jgi:hypothetical protein
MEVAVLGGLVSLGYAVSKMFDGSKLEAPNTNMDKQTQAKPYLAPMKIEGFQNTPARPQYPSPSHSLKSSVTGFAPELDMMYKQPNGQTYPSEPVAGPQGNAFGYATQKPPLAPAPPRGGPQPEPLETQAAMVEMRSDGLEEEPVYVEGKYVISPLSGERIPSEQFRHNNMMPFFGGRVKQNIGPQTNTSVLDMYTGAGTTQIAKREQETMFDTGKTPFGNPFGLEANAEFIQSRINDPRARNGERPFEPVRVAPGIGEGYGTLGKGGFQQFEVDEIMKRAMPTTDKLRVADNQKLTYETPVVPGQHFVAMPADNAGEVRKQRPDTFYTNQNGERNFVTNGEYIAEATRPTQLLNYTTRPETSDYRIASGAAGQDTYEGYVTGSFRTPMTQQYGGAGMRNVKMEEYYTPNPDAPEADYGKSAIEIRPNERLATSDRVMGLNVAQQQSGLVAVHYEDDARPTYRGDTIGNIYQAGVATGYAQGAPSVTVWDPTDIARTTVKEGTVDWNYLGAASAAQQPNKLKVYDPDDIARPTQKAQLSAALSYTGPGYATNKAFTSHDDAYNMRLNPNKEQISRLRKPIAGNGNIATFNGDITQTSKKINADVINDRANAVNRVVDIGPGAADIGMVKFRAPPQLDIGLQRNTMEMISAVESNPLNQSLRLNAIRDQQILAGAAR